jgi:hypothetical protein
MYVFYAVVILVGVICLVISIFMYLLDKKRSHEVMESLGSKTTKIYEAIQDAEQIVLEMNNFSDYLLSRIDAKVQELEDKIPAEENIVFKEFGGKPWGNREVIMKEEIALQEKQELHETMERKGNIGKKIDLKVEGEKIDLKGLYGLGKEKLSTLNPKHKEIYLLKESGLEDIEIAKELGVGIGEVRLILGMKS